MSFDESMLPPEASAYLARTLGAPHPLIERVGREAEATWLPAIGRQAGGLLRALALSRRAERILEVGTNIGYSGLWLCLGLAPGGRFEGIELDAAFAERAERNLRELVGERASVHRGAALDVLPRLPARAYDLVFLDAVKAEYPEYLDHALRVLRPGGIVAADNLFWGGRVWDAANDDADTRGVREYTRRILQEPRLASTIVPVEDGMGVSVLVG